MNLPLLAREEAKDLTPRAIVAELNRHIVGQDAAKRAVAIALRNRWRRMQVRGAMQSEILPNNIILIGPTGVGKTEIARRLAKLVGAPWVKVEATKFTERGYVGRDVESMVRDLAEAAIKLVRDEFEQQLRTTVDQAVEERLLDVLLPPLRDSSPETQEKFARSREVLRAQLRRGELEQRSVTIEARVRAAGIQVLGAAGGDELLESGLGDALKNMCPEKRKQRTLPLAQARDLLREEELDRRIDMDQISGLALARAEQSGIVFLDEVDKIASREKTHGADVSREGVQRDLLPIVEGSTVQTKYGPLRTDHVLFIAAGAFHMSKPSDLIPELQGRFPIRVELNALTEEDFVRILREPESSLPRQYEALLGTEGCTLEFQDDAYEELGRVAFALNERTENIGARRLHTILTSLLDEMLYELPPDGERESGPPPTHVVVDRAFVQQKLGDLVEDPDLSRYIL